MYKSKAKRLLAVGLALVMTASILAEFPATVFACDDCGASQSQPPPTQAEVNPYVTGGRVRNTETVPLNRDYNPYVLGERTAAADDCITCGVEPKPEFDPNRHWTQDEDGTIWQNGIPFANMDNIFNFDTPTQPRERPPDWQDRRITSSDPDLIETADRLIVAYLRDNNMTMEEALAISHAELPFLILNGEVVRTDRRGIAFTEISEESIHPLARENPRMFNPVYQPDCTKVSVVRSNLATNIVTPIYHNNHPGGYIFAHEFSLINRIGDTYLKVRRYASEDTPLAELGLQWIYDMDPRTRITMIENHPEKFRIFNTWEVMSSFAVWSFEEMEFLPMSAATDNYITPLSSGPGSIWYREYPHITPHRAGYADQEWHVWLSATRSTVHLWFSDFTFQIGGIGTILNGFCGSPWKRTPLAINPMRAEEAQGLTDLWPWVINEPFDTNETPKRIARIATGARGTTASGYYAEHRSPLSEEKFNKYWKGGEERVIAASADPFSNLSTMGMGDEPISPGGGVVRIPATPRQAAGLDPINIPITFQYPLDNGSTAGHLPAFIVADPDWFISTSIPPSWNGAGNRFYIRDAESLSFTLAGDLGKSEIVILITPIWGRMLAGGHRSKSDYEQEIWFALPWFRWKIIIELEEIPRFDGTMVGLASDVEFDWNRPTGWGINTLYNDWNEAVIVARNNNPNATIGEISRIASRNLLDSWIEDGHMGMFSYNGVRLLMNVSSRDEAREIVRGIRGENLIVVFDSIYGEQSLEFGDFENGIIDPIEWLAIAEEEAAQTYLPCKDEIEPCIDSEEWAVSVNKEMCGIHLCEPEPFNRGGDFDERNEDEEGDNVVGLQYEDSVNLRWNNIAFAFAETHMATDGFNNDGLSTHAATINLTRTREVFQAMAGMPETEFLYINVGGREGAFDVEYIWHRRIYQFAIWWVESDNCPLHCEAVTRNICYDCGGNCCHSCSDGGGCCGVTNVPKTYYRSNNYVGSTTLGTLHSDWERVWRHTVVSAVNDPDNPELIQSEVITLSGCGVYRHNESYAQAEFHFLEIRHGQARAATHAQVSNPHLYRYVTHGLNGPGENLIQTPVFLNDLSTDIRLRPIEPGRQETHHYGTDGNLSMFRYKLYVGNIPHDWHTEGLPSERCWEPTSNAEAFRSREAEAHARGIAELGNLFSLNSNLVYQLGENVYQFVRTGGHGSGGPTLVGGPGGTNLVQGPITEWHDAPNPPPVQLFSALDPDYFAPRGEHWHEYEIVPVSGFRGRDHREVFRNGGQGNNPPHVLSARGIPNVIPGQHLVHVSPGHYPQYPDLAWHNPSVPIISRLHNNIYNFVPFLDQNWLNYTTNVLTFPADGTLRNLLSQPEWRHMLRVPLGATVDSDGYTHGGGAASPDDHIAVVYVDGERDWNHVRLEYTAWQERSSPYTIPTGPHQGLTNPTAYMGPNPVIIHNPVSTIFAWVHDVPEFTLQDQRIRTVAQQQDGGIIPHERRTDPRAAARLYVDFDFRITIPNDGTFNTYWHFEPVQNFHPDDQIPNGHPVGRERWSQLSSRSSPLNNDYIGGGSIVNNSWLSLDGRRRGGFEAPAGGSLFYPDPEYLVHNTGYSQFGLRGPGWIGDLQEWQENRNHANPYQLLGSRLGPMQGWYANPTIWDVSNWIAAKYIQFPFDVYYYGTFVPSFDPPHDGSQGSQDHWNGPAPFTAFQSFSGPGHPAPADIDTTARFVPAGTWITLYDTGTDELSGPGNDPTEFAFRIPSHVADLQNQEIRIVARSINSPRGNLPGGWSSSPNDLWYGGTEWNINGMRLPQGTGTLNTASTHPTGSGQDQEAFHATATVLTVDVIGRIGNVLVDDNTDPQWINVFWETDENNRPLINSPVWRAIGQHYNMLESVQNHEGLNRRPHHPRNSAVGGIFNRFSQLHQWHGMDATLLYQEHHGIDMPYTLPLERNPQPQYSQQVTGLGYEFQYSIQTLGRYGDGEMWVHPRYILLGDWATHPGGDQDHFQMFATNPFDPTGVRQMFYDSAIPFANWQFGSTGATQQTINMAGGWQPDFHHQIWHSLADPRAKVNTMERETFSFIEAVRRGQNYRWHLGDPSFIRIPTELRTHQGGPVTKGRIGEGINYGYIESSTPDNWANQGHAFFGGPNEGTWGGRPINHTPDGSPLFGDHGSNWENAHRWNARHHLPNSTEIIFYDNRSNSLFEGRTNNQYIGVNFTFRTHANNGLWDLATYTGAARTSQPYGTSLDAPPHDRHIITPPYNPRPVPNRLGRNRGREWWLRPQAPIEADRGDPHWVEPNTPIIIFDYSRPAQSDRITIGTH